MNRTVLENEVVLLPPGGECLTADSIAVQFCEGDIIKLNLIGCAEPRLVMCGTHAEQFAREYGAAQTAAEQYAVAMRHAQDFL